MSDSAEQVLHTLLSKIQTIQISSITSSGLPNISYAPYVRVIRARTIFLLAN